MALRTRWTIVLSAMVFSALFAADIDQPQPYRARRSSSYRVDGGNRDARRVPPASSLTVADISGAGRIVHMWFTIAPEDPDYLQRTRLKIYWDGAETPAVDVPFGMFHCQGHDKVRPVNSAFVTVRARPELNHNLRDPNVAGFNSYFPMPYAKGARVVIENTSEQAIRMLYYQIDYQEWPAAPSPLRFHAQYWATEPEPYPGDAAGRPEALNPDGRDNHLVLNTTGSGHFIGMVLSVDAPGNRWWEGDEMMWIDGEQRPSIHGTGTEDYFGGAWGFRQEYTMPYHGLTEVERPPDPKLWQAGRYTVYRFHERDPVPFTRSLRISIERGHNNHRRDSRYESVAYYFCHPLADVAQALVPAE